MSNDDAPARLSIPRTLTEDQRRALFEGYLVFDPRDSEQSLANRSTWKRTHNPALLQAAIILANGGEVDWAYIAKQADICDEPVAATGVAERNYRQPFTSGDACITLADGNIESIVLGGYEITE